MNKEARINLFGILIVSLIAVVMTLGFVLGAVETFAPGTSTNYSASVLFNATLINKTDLNITGINQTAINASFYLNISGEWILFTNSSNCTNDSAAAGAQVFACSATIELNTTNVTEGIYSVNASFTNGTSTVYASALNHTIIFDATPPRTVIANVSDGFDGLVVGGNFSNLTYTDGILVLNASIWDGLEPIRNVSWVSFNITNHSGKQEYLCNATRERNTTYWNNISCFNISKLSEGNYTVIIIANDSFGSKNLTSNSTIIRIDSTMPKAVASNISIPKAGNNYSTVNMSGNMSVNISITDNSNGSGIKTLKFMFRNSTGVNTTILNGAQESTTNYWSSPLNTSSFTDGNYTVYINVTDHAGNANLSTSVGTFIFDNTPPRATLNSVSASATLIGGNFSNLSADYLGGNILLNVTITDTTVNNISYVGFNITNGTGQQVDVINATREGPGVNSWTNANSFNMSVNRFRPGNFTVSVIANDSLGNVNLTTNSSRIIIDTTIPKAGASNITHPSPGTNYTSTIDSQVLINMTIQDIIGTNQSLIHSVLFLVKNATGGDNTTYAASRAALTEGSALSYWNYSISPSSFADGTYTVVAYVNDSAQNTNKTAEIGQFRIDNSAPSIDTLSCTPASVTQGGSVTCSCSGSDATSGLNKSWGTDGVSLTTPSTDSTGTKTATCTVKNSAGLSTTDSTTFIVESTGTGGYVGGGGGGGGTGVTWSSAGIIDTATFEDTGDSRQVRENYRVKIIYSDTEEHYFGVTELTDTEATITVTDMPDLADKTVAIDGTVKFDTNDDGIYDTSITLNGIASEKADLEFKSISEEIPKEELEEQKKPAEVPEEEEEPAKKIPTWVWIVVIVVIVVLILVGVGASKRKANSAAKSK